LDDVGGGSPKTLPLSSESFWNNERQVIGEDLEMVKFVFRPRRKVDGKKKAARLYTGRYRLDGEVAMTEVPLKTTDKQVAEKRLTELVTEIQRESAGLLPPKKLRDSGLLCTEQHLADYLINLSAMGRDGEYIRNLRYRISILILECGWLYAVNVTADSFEAWRGRQRKASGTLNQYLESANAMLNWMTGNGRIAYNPLRTVERVEFKAVRIRRAFHHDEIKRLLEVAGESRIGYLLAVQTGLRRAELKALLWRDVNLDARIPTLLLDGRFTKNKKDADIPLHRGLAAELRVLKPADAKPSDPVLIGKMLPSMWKMRADLKKAGIEYERDGRRVDFHSLRHTLATNLASRNIPPRVAMKIMRHSDIRLTMNHYTDGSRLPVAEAINTLPSFDSTEKESAYTQIHPQNPDPMGNEQSHRDTHTFDAEPTKIIEPERLWHNEALTDIMGHKPENGCLARTRT
jgi:integrase